MLKWQVVSNFVFAVYVPYPELMCSFVRVCFQVNERQCRTQRVDEDSFRIKTPTDPDVVFPENFIFRWRAVWFDQHSRTKIAGFVEQDYSMSNQLLDLLNETISR